MTTLWYPTTHTVISIMNQFLIERSNKTRGTDEGGTGWLSSITAKYTEGLGFKKTLSMKGVETVGVCGIKNAMTLTMKRCLERRENSALSNQRDRPFVSVQSFIDL